MFEDNSTNFNIKIALQFSFSKFRSNKKIATGCVAYGRIWIRGEKYRKRTDAIRVDNWPLDCQPLPSAIHRLVVLSPLLPPTFPFCERSYEGCSSPASPDQPQ